MEENKYYQPEISEFFVGFECQTYSTTTIKNCGKEITHNWYDYIFELDRHYIRCDNYRVKKLDVLDIEALGWENLKTEGTKTFRKIKGLKRFEDGDWCESILMLRFRIIDNVPHITISEFNEHEPTCTEVREGVRMEQIFKGFIKNKSELQKLLKQLEV